MVLRPSCSASFDELGIDEEHDRHVALLAGLEPLIGEAEAVDLGEIGARGRRRDVVGRNAHGLARRFVDDRVVDGHDLADLDLDRVLLRLEPPRQSADDIGVEAHLDLAIEHCAGGAAVATCGVPPKPVVRQNQS